MKRNNIIYNVKRILAIIFIVLVFIPIVNQLYEVYAHKHSSHCTAKTENHLHEDSETFLYNASVVNNYFLNLLQVTTTKIIIVPEFIAEIFKTVLLSKRLIIFYLRPPPLK